MSMSLRQRPKRQRHQLEFVLERRRDDASSVTTRVAALRAHFCANVEPSPSHAAPDTRSATQAPLHPGHVNHRSSDQLQVLSWNPGPVRRDNVSAVAGRRNGPWHIVCLQEGAGFAGDRTLAHNFHVVIEHLCAVLLNEDTLEDDFTCTPSRDTFTCTLVSCVTVTSHLRTLPQGPSVSSKTVFSCAHRYSTWALDGMVVTGQFWRPLDPACQYFTVDNIHLCSECAKRSLCASHSCCSSATCASSRAWC